jgi:hypothetical protein
MLTPVTILGPERIVDIQQADLLVRCRDDDYHVDRSILCHHSQWFSKVYSKVNYPVREGDSLRKRVRLIRNRRCRNAS